MITVSTVLFSVSIIINELAEGMSKSETPQQRYYKTTGPHKWPAKTTYYFLVESRIKVQLNHMGRIIRDQQNHDPPKTAVRELSGLGPTGSWKKLLKHKLQTVTALYNMPVITNMDPLELQRNETFHFYDWRAAGYRFCLPTHQITKCTGNQ